MVTLSIDIETYSSVSIQKSGVFPYAAAPDFRVLLFGYAVDDEPVQVVDLASGEEIPDTIIEALFDPNVIKTAYNAQFERACLAVHFGREMPAAQWACTQAHALTLGLPMRLGDVAKALNLPADKQKDRNGLALIRFFCIPQKTKPDASLFGHTSARNWPEDNSIKWAQFKDYCAQDVEVERTIRKTLEKHPVINSEQELWELDQKINAAGVEVDPVLINHAVRCADLYQTRLIAEAVKLTGLNNPQSVTQIKAWLKSAADLEVESLNKESVPVLLAETDNETVKRVLEIRQELSKTSVKKYEAMDRSKCKDNRIRGLFQYYGANRSGRWAGRLVQVQNLPQNKMKDLDMARGLLKKGLYEGIEMLWDSVPNVLSQLIRTALVAGKGKQFVVSDFSAIEARIIAWLAGEEWRMEVFRTHGKIYEASASQMFRVPIEEITKALRQKGKISELALGYGGGAGALKAMGALNMGLTDEELNPLVKTWRKANPAITALWWDTEAAAMEALQGGTGFVAESRVTYTYRDGILFAHLPSGRSLCYVNPRIEPDLRFGGKDTITYEGYLNGSWLRLKTYGPKLVENLIQGIARDALAAAMIRLNEKNYKIVTHVHDEVVIEAPADQDCLQEICSIMGQDLSWAPGLPLPAAGFTTYFYKKD